MKRYIKSNKSSNIRQLKDYEKKDLAEGNTYSFAHLFLEMYPDIAEQNDISFSDVVNKYKSFVDFNDGIYTIWGNSCKYLFDTQMNFRGTKEY